ncbi:MAG: aldose 1-epimerase [Nitrososphaerota archaeon]|jgi:aldose 1-epimerase|nr:aldose 1-epimerase [Nitrososphaerota archaeon]MDG6947633.1 aldose 1-epimerase [Nitrososphaerota archaeon]
MVRDLGSVTTHEISISHNSTVAVIDHLGAHVKRLSIDGVPVVQPSSDGVQTHGGVAVLLPYAGRVRYGRYSFEGRMFQLPTGKDGHAIHGFAKDIIWDSHARQRGSVVMEASLRRKGYPGALEASITYSVGEKTFSTDCKVRNVGEDAAPLVVGFHPYFIAEEWSIGSSSRILHYQLADGYFPTGKRVACSLENAGRSEWDDCFSTAGHIKLSTGGRELTLRRRNMPYFILYNGKYAGWSSVAVEPYSGLPDAYNNGIGLRVLSPGGSFRCGYSLRLT